jgi:hypothetical protein
MRVSIAAAPEREEIDQMNARRAIITAGASGIGREIARAFAQRLFQKSDFSPKP